MGEYRNRTTGEVKTQGQWRSANRNMSLPKVWKAATLDALDLDPVLEVDVPTAGAYQTVVRNGVEQNSDGDWVQSWQIVDMFADDDDSTKAEKEAAYQQKLDEEEAASQRRVRDKLLADSDWTQMNDSPLTNEVKTAWATYRQELRDLSDLDAWPNLDDADWPVKP